MENVISTSLCEAARLGLCEDLRRLLDAGHHVYNADNRGYTPLHEAIQAENEDCAELLLNEDGCDPNAQTHEGFTPLYLACKHQNKPSLITLLCDWGADCNIGDNEHITPLHLACSDNKIELVLQLLEHQSNVLLKDFNGFTPLHSAVSKNHVNVARELLRHGASVNMGDEYCRTSLYLAVENGWKECVELLIEHGASVNCRTEDGVTPLMAALQFRFEDISEMLLQNGADPDLESHSHQLALSLAVHNGCVRMVKVLLEKTSRDVIIKNSSWAPDELVSLPCLAIDGGSLECLAMILDCEFGPSVNNAPIPAPTCENLFPYSKMTPLGFLLELASRNEEMFDLLLSRGIPVNSTSRDEMPPVVGLIRSQECTFNKKKMYLHKLLKNGCLIDYCSLTPEITNHFHLPDAVLSVCLFSDLTKYDSVMMLHLIFKCSVACNANEILHWLWTNFQHIYGRVLEILDEYGCYTLPSNDLRRPVCSLQALTRCAVRQWLWCKLHNSSRVKGVLDTLKVPLPVQEYLIGSIWFGELK